MFTIKNVALTLNNNKLKNKKLSYEQINQRRSTDWLNIISVDTQVDLSKQYLDICQSHDLDNKWILMINPENESLGQLSTLGKIDPAKILKVNANKVKINIDNIRDTLIRGNCAAVILSNAQFSADELVLIAKSAEQGATECIILKHSSKLH